MSGHSSDHCPEGSSTSQNVRLRDSSELAYGNRATECIRKEASARQPHRVHCQEPQARVFSAEKCRRLRGRPAHKVKAILKPPSQNSVELQRLVGLPWWLSGKESTCQCRRCRFDPWVRKISWRKKWQPNPVLLPGKSHRQKEPGGLQPIGL